MSTSEAASGGAPASRAPASNATPEKLLGRWRLHPRVAIRPEPFGALAYHYGNRRLNFLRSPDLVAVVEHLGDHPSPADALVSCGISERRRPGFDRALAALAASDFLEPVPARRVERSPDDADR